jgi:lipoic acid synthetase
MSVEIERNASYDRFRELSMVPAENANQEFQKKPSWLKTPLVHGDRLFDIKRTLRKGHLHTVCEEAKCPNISECLNGGTATFMILGDTCTRGCRFCNVKTGNPQGLLDSEEPQKVAETIRNMGIDYAVITMVDRDDLEDGGANHVAKTIEAVQSFAPDIVIEVLAGDFCGKEDALKRVLFAGKGLNTFAHNLETVRRKTPRIRDARASYEQSLTVLKNAKRIRPESYTKSGLMLGLGEEPEEIEQTLRDMREAHVEILTLGQYLQPTPRHLSVKRYVHPEEFAYWKTFAESLGFLAVASGPLVRSSYRAGNLFPKKSTSHS